MKLLGNIFLLFIFIFSFNFQAFAGVFDDLIDDNTTEIPYCDDEECWLDRWIEEVWDNLDLVVTDQKASIYFQNVVKYLLWFLYLIGLFLIIYSWYNILTSVWDEEKVKKSKDIIKFTIIWLIIIFLANSIILFVIDVLNQG